jgi:hypothetical protein
MKSISTASRLGVAAAALAGVVALTQPVPAEAAHGGGGGFHGGGFHGGGFHGGGFHGGGFHGGFHGGGFHGGGFHRGFGGGFYGGGYYPGYYGYGYCAYPYSYYKPMLLITAADARKGELPRTAELTAAHLKNWATVPALAGRAATRQTVKS